MADQHYATKDEFYDDGVPIGDGFLRMNVHERGDGFERYWTGDYVDKRGFVSVYRQSGLTRLDAVQGNRMHIRSWRKYYGYRTISRLARAFLTDLHGEPQP